MFTSQHGHLPDGGCLHPTMAVCQREDVYIPAWPFCQREDAYIATQPSCQREDVYIPTQAFCQREYVYTPAATSWCDSHSRPSPSPAPVWASQAWMCQLRLQHNLNSLNLSVISSMVIHASLSWKQEQSSH